MSIKRFIKTSRGDTIVEVLLSIAVLSLVLTISYSLSNKNTQYTQESQERSEAQNISQEQLETLRKYLASGDTWNATYKCFDDFAQPTDGSGNACQKGIKDNGVGRYGVNIVGTDTDGDGKTDTYTIDTNWSSLTSGTTQQSLEFSYKLPIASLNPTGIAAICNDGHDNDGDGLVDMADPGCSSITDNNEYNPPPTQCNDGIDNDGDGLKDYPNDPGCSSASDNSEYNAPPAQCNDGADNDGDGLVDMADPGCSGSTDNDEYNSPWCFKICF